MDIGIFAFLTDHTMDVVPLAQGVEELGFESLWVPEHPIMPVHTTSRYPGSADGVIPKSAYRLTDPFVTLARASAVTSRIKLGTGIVLVPERNPLLLAKEIATLDMYSGGRFLFGIGAGWCREETEMMGGDFDHRWGQTREAILAMKELWTADAAEYHGRFYDFPPVYSFPKPVRQPHPPVHLRGNAPKVLERVVAWDEGSSVGALAPRRRRRTSDSSSGAQAIFSSRGAMLISPSGSTFSSPEACSGASSARRLRTILAVMSRKQGMELFLTLNTRPDRCSKKSSVRDSSKGCVW